MRKFLTATALVFALSAQAEAEAAERIAVSMGVLQSTFQHIIVEGMEKRAAELGIQLQVEDANSEATRQLDQVRNFAAGGYSAIIVDPVDSSATGELSQAAAEAGIPLVYVNVAPANVARLGEKEAYVGSDELESGKLQAKEVCRLLGGKGDVVVMIGDLSTQAARDRTQDVHDVVAMPECRGMKVVDEQVGQWTRVNATDLMANWLTSGRRIDAVIANNDEMALGALVALKGGGVPMKDVVVAGIDATAEALAAMKAGELDVTVFQDAKGQGAGAVDAAMRLIKGERLDKPVWIPFQLVTPANMADFAERN